MSLDVYQTRLRLVQLLPPLRNGRVLTQECLHLLLRSDVQDTQERGVESVRERLVHARLRGELGR